MSFLLYFLVFLASFLVDVIPFIGPPAWTVMVFFQVSFKLDIWWVLVAGVIGSAIGRYVYSLYIPLISDRFIKEQKNEDLKFIGSKFKTHGWKVQLFVLLYTLMPLPTTPLFTAAGISRIKTIYLIPTFLVGKFLSDALMVLTGDYVAKNISSITSGLLSWQSLVGTIGGIIIVGLFLFTDWRTLLQEKKFRLSFHIWK
jgi:membrane protein DedA with SNARE-associated domain